MKGEERMSFDMNEKEMVNNLIDKYADLQRIKKAEKAVNEELELK